MYIRDEGAAFLFFVIVSRDGALNRIIVSCADRAVRRVMA